MTDRHEKPEEKREKLRQEELKQTSSSIHGSNLSDLVGGMSWKGAGFVILSLIVILVVLLLFFR